MEYIQCGKTYTVHFTVGNTVYNLNGKQLYLFKKSFKTLEGAKKCRDDFMETYRRIKQIYFKEGVPNEWKQQKINDILTEWKKQNLPPPYKVQ
jgi:hypothetical protein